MRRVNNAWGEVSATYTKAVVPISPLDGGVENRDNCTLRGSMICDDPSCKFLIKITVISKGVPHKALRAVVRAATLPAILQWSCPVHWLTTLPACVLCIL